MIEPQFTAALNSLFGGRVYPDLAPQTAVKPFLVYGQVGGVPSNTLCGNTDVQNGRFQFDVWATTRAQASTLMRQVEAIMTAPPFRGVSQGGLVASYDEATKSYGARWDVSLWFVP